MLSQAFDGEPPVCIKIGYDGSVLFLERKGSKLHVEPELLEAAGVTDVTALYADPTVLADVSTDDWPFLYMPRRVYPLSYVSVLCLLLAMSLSLVGLLSPARPTPRQVPFLLLGAGFMLVETKSITELGLTFGNTWQVIGVVITGILVMAFLANLVVMRLSIERVTIPYALLLASLALGWIISGHGGFPSTIPGRVAALVIVTIPLFFSGLIFSAMLESRGQISGIMAANLIGVICGGCLEYNSMYFGFRFLYLIAMAIYGASFLTYVWGDAGVSRAINNAHFQTRGDSPLDPERRPRERRPVLVQRTAKHGAIRFSHTDHSAQRCSAGPTCGNCCILKPLPIKIESRAPKIDRTASDPDPSPRAPPPLRIEFRESWIDSHRTTRRVTSSRWRQAT